jgi:CheY-like chemotaxis protein
MILFVDDNTTQNILYKKEFPNNVYASSLKEALYILDRTEFDWIVTDLAMPNSEPIEVVEELDSPKTIFVSFHENLESDKLNIKEGFKIIKNIHCINKLKVLLND